MTNFFVGKLREAFAQQKFLTFFDKNGSIFVYITFENLTSRQSTTSLVLKTCVSSFFLM